MRTAPTTGDDSARPELMLSAGDPVNLGERRHLIVKLADVAAHNVRLRENRCPRATSHRRPMYGRYVEFSKRVPR